MLSDFCFVTSNIFPSVCLQVSYEMDGFIEKNRDTLPENVFELLKGSRFSLVSLWNFEVTWWLGFKQ